MRLCRCYFPLEHIVFLFPFASQMFLPSLVREDDLNVTGCPIHFFCFCRRAPWLSTIRSRCRRKSRRRRVHAVSFERCPSRGKRQKQRRLCRRRSSRPTVQPARRPRSRPPPRPAPHPAGSCASSASAAKRRRLPELDPSSSCKLDTGLDLGSVRRTYKEVEMSKLGWVYFIKVTRSNPQRTKHPHKSHRC